MVDGHDFAIVILSGSTSPKKSDRPVHQELRAAKSPQKRTQFDATGRADVVANRSHDVVAGEDDEVKSEAEPHLAHFIGVHIHRAVAQIREKRAHGYRGNTGSETPQPRPSHRTPTTQLLLLLCGPSCEDFGFAFRRQAGFMCAWWPGGNDLKHRSCVVSVWNIISVGCIRPADRHDQNSAMAVSAFSFGAKRFFD